MRWYAINIPDQILDDLLRQGGCFNQGSEVIVIFRVGKQSIDITKKLRTLGYDARSVESGWRGRKSI